MRIFLGKPRILFFSFSVSLNKAFDYCLTCFWTFGRGDTTYFFPLGVLEKTVFNLKYNRNEDLKKITSNYVNWLNHQVVRTHAGIHGRVFIFFFFISWRLITLQYCSGFCHTLIWISHGYTYIPHPDPLSHLPLHPVPLGLPSAPGPSTCLMHPTWAGDLFHPR